ncbi:MAG: hypothetical protein ACW97Z_17450 [Candidatus Hodarchaeales archaeon]|jgi:hypothetical protein
MDKKLRIRDKTNSAELFVLKMLPLIFVLLLFLMSASLGAGAEAGLQPGMD